MHAKTIDALIIEKIENLESYRQEVRKSIPESRWSDDTFAAYVAALAGVNANLVDLRTYEQGARELSGSKANDGKGIFYTILVAACSGNIKIARNYLEAAKSKLEGSHRTDNTLPLYATAFKLAQDDSSSFETYQSILDQLDWCNKTPDARAINLLSLTVLEGDTAMLDKARSLASKVKGYNSTSETRALYTFAAALEVAKNYAEPRLPELTKSA